MGEIQKHLLIIFYRNPKTGPVKTRLAATIGKARALEIYQKLARHTRQVTEKLPYDKTVYYTDTVDRLDGWPNDTYQKALQQGEDLGVRMHNAFVSGFEAGYEAICIIGTDCWEITDAIIQRAFDALQSADAVIGPAQDGGYYLLGLKGPQRSVFRDKTWSTHTVFRDTVADFDQMGLKYEIMPVLRDVDVEDDLPQTWLE